ncbi:MAG TPA: DUF3500 domain-containing protein [Bryobacteraceae bacterium]|nr:DUF3500 domain-containing protein [Bryobacteraceae bacterium]
MKTLALRVTAMGIATILLTAAYSRMHTPAVMAETAKAFLASLDPEQRARATFQFADDERLNWHYIPKERKGLPFKEMNAAQKHLAHALLSAGLSQRGYIKAVSIMSLDEILRVMENGTGPVRDPERYFFSVFGEPSDTGTWGYRVEGHHVSQNFTIVNGKVQVAPSFFGANPAEVREGPRKGLRVLGREEDLGRAFIQSLTPEQKKVAIVSSDPPGEILTGPARKAALTGQPSGISAAKLNPKQRELLQNLLDEYCNNVPEEVAQMREEQIKKAAGNLYVAWAGGEQVGQPHYYRIQAPAFLIEYDDTQNNANHIHTVWRDLEGDFGLDLLKEHYQTSHR